MGYQRTPDLCIDGIFTLSVEVMKLEVLLHFLEQYLDTPSFLVKECDLFCLNIKVVCQKS